MLGKSIEVIDLLDENSEPSFSGSQPSHHNNKQIKTDTVIYDVEEILSSDEGDDLHIWEGPIPPVSVKKKQTTEVIVEDSPRINTSRQNFNLEDLLDDSIDDYPLSSNRGSNNEREFNFDSDIDLQFQNKNSIQSKTKQPSNPSPLRKVCSTPNYHINSHFDSSQSIVTTAKSKPKRNKLFVSSSQSSFPSSPINFGSWQDQNTINSTEKNTAASVKEVVVDDPFNFSDSSEEPIFSHSKSPVFEKNSSFSRIESEKRPVENAIIHPNSLESGSDNDIVDKDFFNQFDDKLFGSEADTKTKKKPAIKAKSTSNFVSKPNIALLSSSLPSDPIDGSDISFLDKTPVKLSKTLHRSETFPNAKDSPGGLRRYNAVSANPNVFLQFDKKTLKKVNKISRTKTEIALEMILNMDSDLVKQFGLTSEKLAVEFHPSTVRTITYKQVLQEGAQTINEIQREALEGVTFPNAIPESVLIYTPQLKLFTWSRKANKEYSHLHKCFFPLKATYNKLEEILGIYYDAETFIKDYQSGTFSKEFKKLKQKTYPTTYKQFIIVMKGYQNLLSKVKRKANRAYTNKVRSYMDSATQDDDIDHASKKRRKGDANDSLEALSAWDIESTIIDLQLTEGIHFFPIQTTSDFLMWLKSITYAIGVSYYEKATLPQHELSTTLGPVKGADKPADNLKGALQQLKYVTRPTADRISEKYPSIMKLYAAAKSKKALGKGFDGKPLTNTRIESTIVKLFNADDPDELLHED